MKKRSYKRFTVYCLILDAFFLLGTVWVWRQNVSDVPDVLNVQDEQIGRTWDFSTSSSKSADFAQNDEKSLPDKFNLAVPFTSQAPEKKWDQPWQDACEEAALLMLDAYYKKYNLSPLFARDEILKAIAWEEEERGLGSSLHIEQVKEVAEEYFKFGMVKVLENPTIEDIKKSIVKGNPVLAVAYGKDLPNPHYRGDGPEYHALVITGYDQDEFITNDPGTQFGRGFKFKYEDLMNAVHDWNGGDVKNGRKVMLVIDF